MKKLMIAMLAAVGIFITGCDPTDNPEAIKNISKAIGVTTGYVVQTANVDETIKTHVLSILDFVSKTTPSSDSTVASVWKPIIETEVTKLVDAGKLKLEQSSIIKVILNTAAEGVDYVFVKYPKWKESVEIVTLTINSFNDGFASVVKSVETKVLASGSKPKDVDAEAYEYLKAKYQIEMLKVSKKK